MKRMMFALLVTFLIAGVFGARAYCANAEQAEARNPIPPGTVITMQNWQKYQQYMNDGLRGLFAGTWLWKFPPDFQMDVTAYKSHPLPKAYIENTEKYAGQVKIVDLPNGGHNITGYVAGLPFPNPQEPMRGWKLLLDDWYAYQPYVICAAQRTPVYFQDRLGNITNISQIFLIRRMSHVSDPGMPINPPEGKGIDLVEYAQILSPEQAHYTTALNVYYDDLSKPQDSYLFIPALRRSLRLSTAARCAPFFGSDWANDDTRHGCFNGNAPLFDADYLGERQILEGAGEVTDNYDLVTNLNNYYRPLFFGKPILGAWEVRPVWVVNVHRIPALAAGYCYGKRILYIDKEVYQAQWADLYDENNKFWKVDYDPQGMIQVPGVGPQWTNTGWGMTYDVENTHESAVLFKFRANQDCKNVGGVDYTSVKDFYSVSALSKVMR